MDTDVTETDRAQPIRPKHHLDPQEFSASPNLETSKQSQFPGPSHRVPDVTFIGGEDAKRIPAPALVHEGNGASNGWRPLSLESGQWRKYGRALVGTGKGWAMMTFRLDALCFLVLDSSSFT